MISGNIYRGDIWLVDFNPVVGHDQAGQRPGLIISVDLLNNSKAGVVFVIPMTTKHKDYIPSRISISTTESGLDKDSSIICENMRAVSILRLKKRLGQAPDQILEKVEKVLQRLLGKK